MTINRPKKIKINFAQVTNDDNPVIEVVTRQRKGRSTLASKLDKLQYIKKNKPVA
jgi:hypothetical protein